MNQVKIYKIKPNLGGQGHPLGGRGQDGQVQRGQAPQDVQEPQVSWLLLFVYSASRPRAMTEIMHDTIRERPEGPLNTLSINA